MNINTKHLPGISRIMVGTDEAVIFYKDSSRANTRLSADNTRALLELLESFLVPLDRSTYFSTVSDFNEACDRAEECTLNLNKEE